MAVADQEEQKTNNDLSSITGIGAAEERDMEARATAGADQDKAAESDKAGKGYTGEDTSPSRAGGIKARLKKKSTLLGVGLFGVGGGGILGFFSIIQGPMQIVQFSQMLQKFHFSSNENFGDDRSNKVLIYAMLGATDKGRLGVISNTAADKYSSKLLRDSGMRPMFSERTGRFVGYSFSDENKALQTLTGLTDRKKASKALENAIGKGAELRTIREINNTDGRQRATSSGGNPIDPSQLALDLERASPREKRTIIRGVLRESGMGRINTAIASRLLIKRGGIDFSPLKNATSRKIEDKIGNRATDREKRAAEKEEKTSFLKARAERMKTGVRSVLGLKNETGVDEDGNRQTEDVGDVSDVIAEAKDNPGRKNLKGLLTKSGGGAAAAVGVLCVAKSFGDDIPQYRQTNIVMPMMRQGMDVITMGEQIRSSKNLDMAELAAVDSMMYDEETKSSWASARSIQAENGEELTGDDLPVESKIGDINDKPALLKTLDEVPGLGSACSVGDFIGGLPVIKQIGDAASSLASSAAKVAGVDIEELMQGALAAASGNSINPLPEGAELGNIANYGARYAANDQAASTGGAPMSTAASAALRQENTQQNAMERSNSSFYARYMDPYSADTLAGTFVRENSLSTDKVASVFTQPTQLVSSLFTKLSSVLIPRTQAATYSYGTPEIGFSLDEQTDSRFENPYENAAVVEPKLQELNDKYSDCFSIKLIDNGPGNATSIETGESVNTLTNEYLENCDPKNNSDEMYLRYRFYLADTITAKSLACYYDDETACQELGMGSGSESTSDESTSSGELPTGESTELAQKIIDSGNVTGDGRYMKQIQDVASGKGGCHINPTILGLIVTISENHKIYITSLNRLCTKELTASGTGSYHYREKGGHALDIGIVDGVSSTGNTEKDRALLTEILPLLPSGSGIGQVGCRPNTLTLPQGITQFPDSCNHVHIQVPVQ